MLVNLAFFRLPCSFCGPLEENDGARFEAIRPKAKSHEPQAMQVQLAAS